ncbi:uncharacterized protein BP5553_06456 [Venustampulla echinocandica]|uniref:Uncharacterized protein n=1 Tax=Venustampulla echinocandica TaxID=2656787 RepID=A0A370TJZ7_9HELO|nr:uncharacterized protein BP5553_06456 [Venustampulla echinocandica]RDL35844.1 hypothetical protein BP5553_06456 [Venustampulla echinocandica]
MRLSWAWRVVSPLVDNHLAAEGGDPEAADSDNRLQSSLETAQENPSAAMNPTADEASVPDGLDEMLAEPFLQFSADEFDMLFEPLQSTSPFDPSSVPQRALRAFSALPYDSSLSAPGVNPLCPVESLLPSSSQPDSRTT